MENIYENNIRNTHKCQRGGYLHGWDWHGLWCTPIIPGSDMQASRGVQTA